jgi:hypothetical protein
MTADNKQSEQKDSKPIVPRNKDDAVTMLCIAARDGNLDEISRLAKWEHALLDQLSRTPPVINGSMWKQPPGSTHQSRLEQYNTFTNLTNVNIDHAQFQDFIANYPLLAALEAPNADTFLTLISFKPKPQSFIKKYPFALIHAIIWWPLWPQEQKLKALEAVWDALLIRDRAMLKGENGATLTREDLFNFLKNPVAKLDTPKSDLEIKASGGTPLTKAVERGQLEVVKRLLDLDQGASIEKTDNEGNTALLIASRRRDLTMMRLLYENGASVTAKNKNGETALVLAARPNGDSQPALRRAAVNYLITEAGANPGDGWDIASYLGNSTEPRPRTYDACVARYGNDPTASVYYARHIAGCQKNAASLVALYNTYLAKQQARIDEALETLFDERKLLKIIGGYAALHPDGDLDPTPKMPHPQSNWKDTQPTMVNLAEEQQNGEKEFKSIGDAAKFFNKSGFQGTSGWSVTGAEEISATFDNVLTLEQAKKKLKHDYPHTIFRETATKNITTTSSTLDPSYYLHATVKVSQASDVVQSHSSASSNPTPMPSRSGSTGSNHIPRLWQPAGSTNTSGTTSEQQPAEQDGSDLNLR